MVEEIQRTGDIFFPGRWLDASLGGHNQGEAADAVRDFLAQNPDLSSSPPIWCSGAPPSWRIGARETSPSRLRHGEGATSVRPRSAVPGQV